MRTPKWRVFLHAYNAALLTREDVAGVLPAQVAESGWLGYGPASKSEITAAERRLGKQLPLSYRNFLQVSNGWRQTTMQLSLLSAAELKWFRDDSSAWIKNYVESMAGLPPVPDADYLVYGETQRSHCFRPEYLWTALQVSDISDSRVLLLNPATVTVDGEWEVWLLDDKAPGALRYRTFVEWFAIEREAAQQISGTTAIAASKACNGKKPVSAIRAQSMARAGDVDAALESLETLAMEGSDSCAASLAELYAFLGQWERVVSNAGRLIANPEAAYASNVFDDMIRLLGCAGHYIDAWDEVVAIVTRVRRQDDRGHRRTFAVEMSRQAGVLDRLLKYAERKGRPPHELIAVSDNTELKKLLAAARQLGQVPEHFRVDEGVAATNSQIGSSKEEEFYAIVANAEVVRPDLKGDAKAKAAYLFALAKDRVEAEAMRLYETNAADLDWDASLYAARVYARKGQEESAWLAIRDNVHKWWPVSHAQVAPVDLVIDTVLSCVMSKERCRKVLETPRGPEGPLGKERRNRVSRK